MYIRRKYLKDASHIAIDIVSYFERCRLNRCEVLLICECPLRCVAYYLEADVNKKRLYVLLASNNCDPDYVGWYCFAKTH